MAATLSAALWAYACGDGTTEPPSPPPDPPRPTTVTVSPAAAELAALAETVQLSTEVRDQNGQVLAGVTVAWASDNMPVATVDGAGLVTAVGNGTATITATAGSASGTATVTVAQEVSVVAVYPAADTLVTGDTLRLAAGATDANGHPMEGAEFAWASNDTLVAVVDTSGLLTAVGAGEVEVTATAAGITGRADLTILAPVPTTVVVTPDTVALTALGQTAQLTAEVLDQVSRVVEGVPVSWASADTTVAAVDSSGLVTAIGVGATMVTAAAGEASGEAVVKVMQSAGSVVVSPSADMIAVGDTIRLVAEAFDENGHSVEGAEFDWSSSAVSVATVDATGLVTGVAEGTATITAATGDAGGTAEITVANPDRAALVVLYNATNGPNWVNNDGWLTDAPLRDWYGVDTDSSGRVVRLDLIGQWDFEAQLYVPHGLRGPIPSEIGDLSNLKWLQLTGNELAGPIPAELGRLTNLDSLDLRLNELSDPMPAELGNLANLRSLDLSGNRLTGRIPAELGSLASLTELSLSSNEISGPIPTELGDLTNLTRLILSRNNLTGSIPESFLRLAGLTLFSFDFNDGLCAPGTPAFLTWADRIALGNRTFCHWSDAAVLRRLYQTSGGPDWTNSTGWLENQGLQDWYGVTVNSLGRVVALDLTRNGLSGRLPGTSGDLAEITSLRIGDNALSGRLPLSLTQLPLVELRYANTGLCVPPEESFQSWLKGIASHEGSGVECPPLSDREILVALHDATRGPHWKNSDNWVTDAPLAVWYGVRTDVFGRVTELDLEGNVVWGPIPPELGSLADLKVLNLSINGLTGAIPPRLGNLAGLEQLNLSTTQLSGPIPPELGRLSGLEQLDLSGTDLSGPIPPELGRLSSLEQLDLSSTDLSGPIPPELGNLANLEWLNLSSTDLSGPIPPELGDLDDLVGLYLNNNALTGAIPPELGNLSTLHELVLTNNDLSGSVPAGISRMASLRELSVANNPGMAGPLPGVMTSMRRLVALLAQSTGLCAPAEAGFHAWLESVHRRRIASCAAGDPAMVYLTQAVQSRQFPVPLVAGERALLRVFPTAQQATSQGIPAVRARFYINGRETHVEHIAGKSAAIPTEVDESSLSKSANAEISGHIVQPGLEMVIEVDPERILDTELGVAKRIPTEGRLAVDVRAVPVFDLTLIPFIWTRTHDASIVDLVRAMAADPENHEILGDTRTLLPVGDLRVTAHEPVLSSSNDAFKLLQHTAAIRAMEGGTGHYKGMMSQPVAGPRGLGKRPGRSSFSTPGGYILAHELGHNMNLRHAPCGGPGGPDVSYPYPDGSIGTWGYDFNDGGSLVRPSRPDLMSYCFEAQWIGDYGFTNALRYRLFDEASPAAAPAASSRSLLLWGGVGRDTLPYLEPAFVVYAPPLLSDSVGEHTITGRTDGGAKLFSFDFTMPETADGDGISSFAFVLPVGAGWEDTLASITLTGPDGSATLDGESDLPMAILRNPGTGQIRAILRDPPPAGQMAADAGAAGVPGLEVLFSRGIPGAEGWER